MGYAKIVVPPGGERIRVDNGKLVVPDTPYVCFIEGDGIGVDITPAMRRVLDAAVEKAYRGQRRLIWVEIYAGEKAYDLYREYLPEETFEALRDFLVGIKGPLTTPVGGGFRSLNVTLRQVLDLYACVRPVRWVPGAPSPLRHPEQVDMVIFRENTEDVYAGIEWPAQSREARRLIEYMNDHLGVRVATDAAIGVKPVTEQGSKRLVRKAIQYALERKRRSVTLMHKGNIMKYTEGAFREWGYEVAAQEFGDVTVTEAEVWEKYNGEVPAGKILIKDRIADNMFQQILTRTAEYDVIATLNLNGDYISDAAAGLIGGLGMAPGANIGDVIALFEATHGTAPKYAGQDKVNPSSLILSGKMLLEYLGWDEAAELVWRGLAGAVRQKRVTYDLHRQMEGATLLKTSEFAEAIVENMDTE